MTVTNRIALAIFIPCLLVLSACLGSLPLVGDSSMVTGAGFKEHLANEYTNLAEFEGQYMNDKQDAAHFEAKARRVSRGQQVMPDMVESRNIPHFAVEELERARARLIDALRTMYTSNNEPLLALAQSRFDCWLAHQEDYPVEDAYISCKMFFYDALSLLSVSTDTKFGDVHAVFFDSGMIELHEEAKATLRDVAEIMEKRSQWDVTLIGFTDSKGDLATNKQLSMRRAIAVKNFLGQNGVPFDHIHIAAAGEISDGPDDAHNRRVEIELKPSYVADHEKLSNAPGWQHMGKVN